MIRHIMASRRVQIGVSFLFLLLASSFLYPYYQEFLPKPDRLMYNDEGKLIAAAPFSPFLMPPFGSDRLGTPLLYPLLQGAKFTVGFALVIGFLRILIGACIGIWLSLYTKRLKVLAKRTSQSLYNIPTVFLAFILIAPVYISIGIEEDIPSGQWIIILYQLAVGIGVAIPSLAVYITNEVDEHMKQEYMLSAKVMGASRRHIFRTHIQLFLREKLLVLFIQHVVQALILFAHLGLLNQFIGGTRVVEMDFGVFKVFSLTSEWAGMIGVNQYELNLSYWIVLAPLTAFAIVIFFLNLITEGVKAALAKRVRLGTQQKETDISDALSSASENLFVLAAPKRKADTVSPLRQRTGGPE